MTRILVVDDEDGVRSFVSEALDMDGHTVDQADGGAAALALLGKREYDLMITDLKMPGMSGIELLDAARAQQPSLQVIVLSAHGSVETAVEAMKRGALDFIQKPVSGPAELRLLAKRALEHRRLLAVADRAARDAGDDIPLSYGDPAMTPVVDALRKVARTTSTVLLVGDSGTGKEVAARAVHRWSPRAAGPFVAINCAALSRNLLESELFGHERGAFTGADSQRRGRIELADGGTFFLDEVGELAPELQAKLLRVIQERAFVRVGGSRTIDVDVRWVAATNRDLHAMMESGAFREDLFHRLAVFPVRMPALRDRPADLGPLAAHVLSRIAAQLGRPGLRLADDARAHIASAAWPGNVRELANALERAAILADGDTIRAEHLWMNPLGPTAGARAPSPGGMTLAALEERAIRDALAAADGSVKDAAEQLGIPRRTLYDKLKKYGINYRVFPLAPNDVHVWTAVPEEVAAPEARAHCASLLSHAETARMARFHFDVDRHTYLVAHALVRTVLSRYDDVPPRAWAFDIGEHGRPEIQPGVASAPLRFNLSHTRGLVAVAVTLDRDIGVDVEHVRRTEVSLDVADRFFAPSEVAALRALPPSDQRDRFFAYWTLKESYIKARGMGLALPLSKFAFDVDSGDRIAIDIDEQLADDPQSWWFCARRAGDDHRLAVAARVTGADAPQLQIRPLVLGPPGTPP